MKKFIAVVMAVMMVTVMSLAIGAEEAVPSVDTTAPEEEVLQVIVTPYDKIDEAHPDVDKEKFQDAYDELIGADDLSDLIEGVEGDKVNKVVDVTVIGDSDDELKDGIQVTIDPETDGDFEVVFKGEDGWYVIKDYVVNPDGTITVTIYEEGVIAIIVPGDENENPPQTSDCMLAIVAVMAVAGAALAVVAKKRRA